MLLINLVMLVALLPSNPCLMEKTDVPPSQSPYVEGIGRRFNTAASFAWRSMKTSTTERYKKVYLEYRSGFDNLNINFV